VEFPPFCLHFLLQIDKILPNFGIFQFLHFQTLGNFPLFTLELNYLIK
jgi:hypothetical protein